MKSSPPPQIGPTATRSNPANRRLRAGIVGGGEGSFIGAVHRTAAELDGQALVTAGAMSSDPKLAEQSAAAWFLDRCYSSYLEMAQLETAHPQGIDFVIVATPTHLHYPIICAFIEAGIHVVCDKPLAVTVEEAESLAGLARRSNALIALTHNYTGYPMVREARAMVQAGLIGEIRKVIVEYNQDWLMTDVEKTGNKQAEWRTDPSRAGLSCCVADIGTHAENLLHFITHQQITSLCADLSSFVDGRALDDDANMLLRLSGGGKGTLICSQVACGEANALNIRIYGSKAGLEWHQQEPNTLLYKPAGEPWRRLCTGQPQLSTAARSASRIPSGHPEGYLEAFAVLYQNFIADIRRCAQGETPTRDYPTVDDGVRGLRFVAGAVQSSKLGAQWVSLC